MKFKLQSIARLWIVISFLILTNCSKNEFEEQIKNSKPNAGITFLQFKNETKLKEFNILIKVPVSANSTLNRTATLSEFVIDTVAIQKHISENNKITYSFKIYTLISNIQVDEKYNLVFTKEDDVWEKSIIAFKEKLNAAPNESQLESFEKLYDSRLDNTMMSSNTEVCISELYYIQCDGSCQREGYAHCDGFACTTGGCIRQTIVVGFCGGVGAGPSDPNGGGPTNPGNSGYIPLNPFEFTPNLFDNPAFDDPDYINIVKSQYFFDHLEYAAREWANEHSAAYVQLIQYQIANRWTPESTAFANEMLAVVREDPEFDENAFNFMLKAKINDRIDNDLDEEFLLSVDQFMDEDISEMVSDVNVGIDQLIMHFSIQCAVLRANHPTWSNAKIYYEASKEIVHISLDALGLFPVFGEVADLTNGILYTIEGDGVNATLSYASAVPLTGWATIGVKYAFKLKTVSTIGTKIKLTWKVLADGTIYFGSNNTCRAQLRKVLGLVVGDARQAHHIIPLNKQSKSIVQKASKSGNAFHMNEALNGIPLNTAVHSGSHSSYDNVIQTKFDIFSANNPNATPDECYEFLTDLIQEIRTWIINNPNTPINNIILP